jgi:hypothetical protein
MNHWKWLVNGERVEPMTDWEIVKVLEWREPKRDYPRHLKPPIRFNLHRDYSDYINKF